MEFAIYYFDFIFKNYCKTISLFKTNAYVLTYTSLFIKKNYLWNVTTNWYNVFYIKNLF